MCYFSRSCIYFEQLWRRTATVNRMAIAGVTSLQLNNAASPKQAKEELSAFSFHASFTAICGFPAAARRCVVFVSDVPRRVIQTWRPFIRGVKRALQATSKCVTRITKLAPTTDRRTWNVLQITRVERIFGNSRSVLFSWSQYNHHIPMSVLRFCWKKT